MNRRDNRLSFLAVAVLLLVWVGQPAPALGQTVQGLNFKIAEFFDPPHQAQMKFLLEGSKAVRQGTNRVLVTQPKCQTFREDGEREFQIAAPECLYDSSSRSISSSGRLSVHAAEAKFSIEGVGFLWQQTNSSLFISNQVHTTVHPDLVKSTANQPAALKPDERGLDVWSDQFYYATNAGLALYRDNVRVTGTNLVLNCGLLTVRLPFRERELQSLSASNNVTVEYGELRAASQEAIYSPAEDIIRLKGEPTWHVGNRAGGGDELVLERTNQVLRATGHASLQLPGHNLGMSALLPSSPAATNHAVEGTQLLEILADNYELRTNGAVFRGGVQTIQRNGEHPGGTLRCGTMTIILAGTNQLERLTATENVEIEQGDQGFHAGQAVYNGPGGLLELTEGPRWFAGTSAGNGDRILVTQGAMEVKGNAQMKLPASQLSSTGGGIAGIATKNGPQAPQFAEIHSQDYRLDKESALFTGQVSVDHPQMKWNCETLTVHFPTQGQVDRVVAKKDVVFDLTDDQGKRVHGTGQQAVYTHAVTPSGTNDLVELSGDPILVTSYGTFRNQVIIFDRAQNKLRARGNYKVTAAAEAMPTNRFVMPKVKLTK